MSESVGCGISEADGRGSGALSWTPVPRGPRGCGCDSRLMLKASIADNSMLTVNI